MKLGEIIKEYRKEHRITQQEFADRASLSKGFISMLENNYNPTTKKGITPSIKTIFSCAKAMEMPEYELLRAMGNEVIDISGDADIQEFLGGDCIAAYSTDIADALDGPHMINIDPNFCTEKEYEQYYRMFEYFSALEDAQKESVINLIKTMLPKEGDK